MTNKIAIHWFRQDLRLSDNPALSAAAQHEHTLPIYILDDDNAKQHAMGGASRWWLHHSLTALSQSLGNALSVYKGDPIKIFSELLSRYNIEAIYWNRCYEPWRIKRDSAIKAFLKEKDIKVKTFNGSLLWEPWEIKKNDGTPYKVFTPFFRKGCLSAPPPRAPLENPRNARYIKDTQQAGIEALDLLPKIKWDAQLIPHWEIGEKGAHNRLQNFIETGLDHYKQGRDLPAQDYTSHLSPYLHFGEVSPNQLWHTIHNIGDDINIYTFCSELGWREFSYAQLYYNPTLPFKNLQSKFDSFKWVENSQYLKAWQKGLTGIPMVDAGMRELWQTGVMHNRVRMIVGSFLVKNLRLHWRKGEDWFWDTLVDADLASNSASWQWIAGCGADAAPYFRIFNPVTQGQKFDPDGAYVRRYIPEISSLPNKYLFNPWQAPQSVLSNAHINLGSTYPKPIVDLQRSRQAALDAFKALKTEE